MLTDILLLLAALVVLFFTIRGAFRGLSGELAPLGGIAVAAAVLWFGHPYIGRLAGEAAPNAPALATVLAAAALGLILYFLASRLIRRVFDVIIPQPFNALLGIAVGLLKSALLLSIVCGTYSVAAEQFASIRQDPMEHPVFKILSDLWADRFRDNPKALGETALRAFDNTRSR